MRRATRAGVCAVLAPALVLVMTAVGLTGDQTPARAHAAAGAGAAARPRIGPVAAPRLLASAAFNPMAGNEGYQVFVDTSAELNNTGSIYGAFAVGGDLAVGPRNFAHRAPATASSAAASHPAPSATDPAPDTYWQSSGPMSAASPQTLTVDLGTAMTVAVVQLRMPVNFIIRTQTLSVQTSTNGTTFTTAVASRTYSFNPNTFYYPNANVITVSPTVTGRYVRLSITANSAAGDAQIGSMQVYTYENAINHTFTLAYDPGTFNPNNEKEPTAVLIGGGVNWAYNASGSFVRFQKGFIKVGDIAGTNEPTGGSLTAAGNAYNTTPTIYTGGNQNAPVHEGGLIDFASAFSAFRTRASEIAACPATVQLTTAGGAPLPATIPPNTTARLTLQTGVQNVLNISATNLNNIVTLTFANQPTATTPLIINVDTTGVANSFTWRPPATTGLSATAGSYLLLNFATAVAVTITGANSVTGAVYAPRATVTELLTADTNGSVIAENFVHGGRNGETAGAMLTYLFQGQITSCGAQAVTMAKTASVASTTPGGTVTYTITARNDGTSPVTGATLTDSLADVIDDATLQPGATADRGTVSVAPPNLTWTGDLPVGATATITYSVVVKTPRTGNGRLVNGISSTTPGSTCPSSTAAPECRATVTVSGLTIAKVASVPSAPPGGRVTYTVTVTNSGQTSFSSATFTDSLAGVLDDATYQADGAATVGSVTFTAPNLTWTGALGVGEVATVTYSVIVNSPRTGNGRLTNTITSTTAGSNCPSGSPGPGCQVTVTVPRLAITKVPSATTVAPGGTVGYTVTVTNSGQTPYTGATFTDSLAGVLDDATFPGGATADTGTVSFTSPNLTWTGNLTVGASATITYSVVVRNPDPGNRLLTNAITSTTPGNDCPAGNTNPACNTTVTVLVPGLTIAKSSDVPTTSPGGVVRYTTTITNSGQTTYTAILVRDSLAGVLDDATYNNDATASDGNPVTLAGGVLSWTGNVAVGATVTITYSVTAAGAGDHQLVNTVTSDAAGSNCPTGGTDPRCRSTVPVLLPGLTLTNAADVAATAPGAAVAYTITIANTGGVAYTGLTVTESLAGILDDATYNGDVTATGGQAGVAGGVLTWTGNLAAGAQESVHYSVAVTGAGSHVLTGTVVANVTGSNCPTGSADARCTTSVPVAELNIDFRAVTPDHTTVITTTTPGSIIRFDLTLTNLGQFAYTNILVTNSGLDAIDDVILNGDQTATSGDLVIAGADIRWTGDIPIGDSVFITGTVTVKSAPDLGNRLIAGTTVSAALGSNCPEGTTAAHCRVAIPVLLPQLALVKSTGTTNAVPAQTVNYTITATNSGESDYVGITVQDLLAEVLDDATYNGDAAAVLTPPGGGNPTGPTGSISLDGTTLVWTGDVAIGERVTITYSVTVKTAGTGDKVLANSVISAAPGSTCTALQTPSCFVTVPVLTRKLTIATSANKATATPGTIVTFTATITNSGQLPYLAFSVNLDLAGVVDDATYNNDATRTGTGTLTYTAPVLTWNGALAVAAVVTITFTATVNNPPLGNQTLVAVASSAAAANNCPVGSPDPTCQVSVAVVSVQTLTITKSTQEGATVTFAGQVVHYIITMTNSAATPFAGATFTDPLADVLDDATYNNDVASPPADGTVVFNPADSIITWTGTVPAQGQVTVTYSVTVKPAPPPGNKTLRNTVTSPTLGTNCPTVGGDARCTSAITVLALSIVYTATPATSTPGQTVSLHATLRNTGGGDYHDVTVSFSTTDIGDDADFTGTASADSGELSSATGELVWSGDILIGGVVNVTGAVIVRVPDIGNRNLTSRAVASTPSANCVAGSTDPACVATSIVQVPGLTIVKSSTSTFAVPGGRVPYTLTITNSGETAYTAIEVRDNLSGSLDDATYEPAVIVSGGGTLTFTSPEIIWAGDLAVGGAVTITYALVVNSPDTGDKNLVDVATSTAVGSSCVAGPPGPGCRVQIIVLTPGLTITKTADHTVATLGTIVVYTITIQNTGQTSYTAAVVTDALAAVLDDATFNTAGADRGSVTRTGDTLQWTGDLTPGQTATVTYSVTVNLTSGNKRLTNQVASTAAGNNCTAGSADPRCRTTVTVAILSIVNTVSPTQTVPTGVVNYTLTITNAGAVDYPSLEVRQDFAGVVDDATATGAPVRAGGGTVTVVGSLLTWTGNLPAGATVTVDQAFTVNNPPTGNQSMPAVATSTASGSTCPPANPGPQCTAVATVALPQLTVTSGTNVSTAIPGQVVTVTITATNTGPVTYSSGGSLGVTLTESLTGLLDDAAYNNDAATTGTPGQLTTPAGGPITWILTGDMAPAASVTITYSVTVDKPPTGNRVLTRQVTATAVGANCQAGDSSAACATTVLIQIPALTINKSASPASVAPGGTVFYTLTIENTGQAEYPAGTQVADDLSGVLGSATYLDDATSTVGSVAFVSPILTWTGALTVGQTATVSYSVRVTSNASRQILTNTVSSGAPGANCPPLGSDPRCTSAVTVLQAVMTISKTADLSTVVVGGLVRYSIVVSNDGEAPYTGAVVTDSLAGALDAGEFEGNASAPTGEVSYTEPTLTWTGDLGLGSTVVITYSIRATGGGDNILANTVTSTAIGNSCPPPGTGPTCSTSTPVEAVTITISGLTNSFALSGPPLSTPSQIGAVTLTVTTNSPGGYFVGVSANGPELVPAAPNPDRIPVSDLQVRRTGDTTYSSLVNGFLVLLQIHPGPSQPTGDLLSNDYQVQIPVVRPDDYTITLEYVAMTQ